MQERNSPAFSDWRDRQNDENWRERAEDRSRILEAQVDHLRSELEHLKARHHEVIYSVAWHVVWPVRIIERFLRRLLKAKPVAPALPQQETLSRSLGIAAEHGAMTVEKLAARLHRRIEERL